MKTLPTTQFIALYHNAFAKFPQLIIFDPSGERSSSLIAKLVENTDWCVDLAIDITEDILLHITEDKISEWRKAKLERGRCLSMILIF